MKKLLVLSTLLLGIWVLNGAEVFIPAKNNRPIVQIKVFSHYAPIIKAENEFREIMRHALGVRDYDGNSGYYTIQFGIAGDNSCPAADELMKKHGMTPEKLGRDGFLFDKVSKKSFLLCAYHPKGVLNGVYKILEKTLGVVSPRPLVGLERPFPVTKVTPLALPYSEVPAFEIRTFGLSGVAHRNPQYHMLDWQARNLMSSGGSRNITGYFDAGWSHEPYGFFRTINGHSFHFWLPPKDYFKTHPEYYSLIDGKRVAAVKGAQIALGNPEVVDIIVKRMLAYKKEHPEMKFLPFGCNDTWTNGFGWGDDPLCMKLDSPRDYPKPGSKRPRTFSTRYIKTANKIIDRLNKVFPDLQLSVYAYHYVMMQPPDAPVHPNLQVSFCPLYKCCRHAINDPMCPRNRMFHEWLLGWAKKTKNIFIHDYYQSTNVNTPLMPLYLIKKEIKYYHSLGIKGLASELSSDGPNGGNVYGKEYFAWLRSTPRDFETRWDAAGLGYFAFTRLLWNPDEPLEDIVKLYCDNYYGEAAGKYMAQYHLMVSRNLEISSHPGEKPSTPVEGDFVNTGEWCLCWNWNHKVSSYAAQLFMATDPDGIRKNATELMIPLLKAWKAACDSQNRLVVERVGKDIELMEKYLLSAGFEVSRKSYRTFKPKFTRIDFRNQDNN